MNLQSSRLLLELSKGRRNGNEGIQSVHKNSAIKGTGLQAQCSGEDVEYPSKYSKSVLEYERR
jgi:hypothetical protein